MNKIKNTNKEIFIGLVGGIGVDFQRVESCFKNELLNQGYKVHQIRLSQLIESSKKFSSEIKRIKYYMEKATNLRKKTKIKGILAFLSLAEIKKIREKDTNSNHSYILNSLKRPEEAEIFRKIYGRNFFLVSVNSSINFRKKNLENKEFSLNQSTDDSLYEEIEKLIEKDYSETDVNQKKHGQNVSGTFPSAQIFLNTENDLESSIKRCIDIIFGHPFHTPTKDERNMFAARGIALRSADLSRQVGAVITNEQGDIIASGCNEAPKFGGGFYEPEDSPDHRDFKLGIDKNVIEKVEIIIDFLEKIKNKKYIKIKPEIKKIRDKKTEYIDWEKIKEFYAEFENMDLKVTDLLEFGRSVHAEMAAICDAARRGVKIKGSILYSTTYPCHMCTKLILSVGIKKVVYIDPYPKSKALMLFDEDIKEYPGNLDEGEKNCLIFESFSGVSPRRYLHAFHQNNRKEEDKLRARKERRLSNSPYFSCRNPINYILREIIVLSNLHSGKFRRKIGNDEFKKIIKESYKKLNEIKKLFTGINDLCEEYWREICKSK